MSQLTATARPLDGPGQDVDRGLRRGATRGGSRGATRDAPAPPLRVLPARIATPGNGAFASMCVALLTVGLIALLLLNTALAQGSLEVGQLQRQSSALSDTTSNLQAEIDQASSSAALAKKATQLGMVRANERAYIDVAKGKVTGTAYPAGTAQAFPVITSPTPLPKPAKTATPAPAKATSAATPTKPATTPTAAPTAKPSPTASTAASTAATPTTAPTTLPTTAPTTTR